MVLKAAPYGGFVFSPDSLKRPGSFEAKVRNINNKMEAFLSEGISSQLSDHLGTSLNYLHPAIFPINHNETTYFLVILPIINDPEGGERMCLLVQNHNGTEFEPPLLKEDSWHELNNPLAIISLTLQKVFKKEILDQQDIDTLLERINSCFSRIETFISGQIELNALSSR